MQLYTQPHTRPEDSADARDAATPALRWLPVQRGLHREWLHVYDLWLQPKELPCNQDGEVAEHVCLSLREVEELLVAERFMIDAALVAIDCLLRLGYWQQHSADIAAAMAGVCHPLDFAIHAGV